MISFVENPGAVIIQFGSILLHKVRKERIVVTCLGKFRRKRTKISARDSSRLETQLLPGEI